MTVWEIHIHAVGLLALFHVEVEHSHVIVMANAEDGTVAALKPATLNPVAPVCTVTVPLGVHAQVVAAQEPKRVPVMIQVVVRPKFKLKHVLLV